MPIDFSFTFYSSWRNQYFHVERTVTCASVPVTPLWSHVYTSVTLRHWKRVHLNHFLLLTCNNVKASVSQQRVTIWQRADSVLCQGAFILLLLCLFTEWCLFVFTYLWVCVCVWVFDCTVRIASFIGKFSFCSWWYWGFYLGSRWKREWNCHIEAENSLMVDCWWKTVWWLYQCIYGISVVTFLFPFLILYISVNSLQHFEGNFVILQIWSFFYII